MSAHEHEVEIDISLWVYIFCRVEVPEGLFIATTSSIVDFVGEVNKYFKCTSNNGRCIIRIVGGPVTGILCERYRVCLRARVNKIRLKLSLFTLGFHPFI